MSRIKTRNVIKGTIKTLDKSIIAIQKTKDNLVDIKDRASRLDNSYSDINEESSNEITRGVNYIGNKTKETLKNTKKGFNKTKSSIKKAKSELSKKNKLSKVGKKGIKTAKKTVKTTKKVAKESVKTVQRIQKLARELAKRTVQAVKLAIKLIITAVKVTIAIIKAIIVAITELVTAIAAGGWVAVVIIVVIILVALLCATIYGIFFSSEDTNSPTTMNKVVAEINKEMSDKILQIETDNEYDNYTIISDRTEWKEVLSIYAVKVSNGDNETDVVTLDDDKIKILKTIFWDMNSVDFEIVDETDEDSNEDTIKKILNIKISSKSVEDMMNKYNFSSYQREQVLELLDDSYNSLWNSVIYGVSEGSPSMVEIALSQVGNVGGQPYWSWYGFNSRVEWCAVFVSWVADKAGYVESGIIPKFSGTSTGVNWFKAIGEWEEPGFVPFPGDIIFFDWEQDGSVDHVGIVERVEGGIIHTVEGNSTDDMCRQQQYEINSKYIFGYGTPTY